MTRFFASGFFHESVFPKPLIIPIRGDIRSSRFATGVNDTGGKWKNLQSVGPYYALAANMNASGLLK